MSAAARYAEARALQSRGDTQAALAAYDDVLTLEPRHAAALNSKGALLGGLGRHAEALAAFEALTRVLPLEATAHYNRGRALAALDRFEEAREAYEKALRLDRDLPGVANNLGAALEALGRREEAMAAYDSAAARGEANGIYNKALMLLARGDYAEGFRLYENRFAAAQSVRDPGADEAPRWDGAPLEGVLRIWCEQGVGDQVLFTRLLPLALERAPRVAVETDARLAPLLQRAHLGVDVRDRANPLRSAAAQIGVGSLAHALSIAPGDLGSLPPRLAPDPVRMAALRAEYRRLAGGRPIVGVAWASPAAPHARQKSAPIAAFAPLLRENYFFVSLQYGAVSAEGAPLHVDPGIDQMRDLDGFAAQLAALDHIVSVSSTLVHLAGAMGLPAQVLVAPARGLHWYWGLEGETTPWYPSLRLVRRAPGEDWREQVARAAAEAPQMLARRDAKKDP